MKSTISALKEIWSEISAWLKVFILLEIIPNIYMAGGMEAEEGLGADWRADCTPFLKKWGAGVLNPVLMEPAQLKGYRPDRLPDFVIDKYGNEKKVEHWHDLKFAKDKRMYLRWRKYMREVINFDCDLIETNAAAIVVLWNDKTARGAGTHSELTVFFRAGLNRPIYCVDQSTVENPMPGWARACCDEFFDNFEDLRTFLTKNQKDIQENLLRIQTELEIKKSRWSQFRLWAQSLCGA